MKSGNSKVLFVGEAAGEQEAIQGEPFVGGAGVWLNAMLRGANTPRNNINILNVLGCRPPGNAFPTSAQWDEKYFEYFGKIVHEEERRQTKLGWKDEEKYNWAKSALAKPVFRKEAVQAVDYCTQHHFWPQLNALVPTKIIALGNEALEVLTNRSGIQTWRGSPLCLKGHEQDGPKVIPTLHPAFLMRQATMFDVAVGDIKKSLKLPLEDYNLYGTVQDLEQFDNRIVSFDFEWSWDGAIKICGLSNRIGQCTVWGWDVDKNLTPIMLSQWQTMFEGASELIGHNIINADTKYFEKFGWNVEAKLWDTMLMSHLVMPDFRKGLGFVASVTTNKVFWKGDRGEEEEDGDERVQQLRSQWQTWDKDYAIAREHGGYGGCTSADEAYRLYNARDTEGCLQAFYVLKDMLKRYHMEDVYWNVSVPVGFICRDLADAGLKIDKSKLESIREDLDSKIASEECKLPDGLRPYEKEVTRQVEAPPDTYKPKIKKCLGLKGLRHEVVELTFTNPEQVQVCPECGKEWPSGKMQLVKRVKVPGKEIVRPWNSTKQILEYVEAKGLPVKLHMKTKKPTSDKNARKGWVKKCPEFVIVDQLKKWSTLKNSFAKDELLESQRMYFNLLVHGTAEGRLSSTGRDGGLNVQNQPKVIRNIYVPDHDGWGFLQHDFKQGENMLTAWLAKDWDRWERLNTPGYDEHSDMASKFFNLSYESCVKGGPNEIYRAPGKVINHGKNYGLGPKKALEYIVQAGMTQFTLSDIQELFAIWEKVNAGTAKWQQETVTLAKIQGYLTNAFGRTRWFNGGDIAGKALAFLPASTLADITLRCMIAHYPDSPNKWIINALNNLKLDIMAAYCPSWRMCIQVHDSIVSQGPREHWKEQAVRTKEIMTQPWRELDGFRLGVDVEYSEESWGQVKGVEV